MNGRTLLVFIAVMALATTVSANTADIVLLVDESGSMYTEHAWIPGMIASMEADPGWTLEPQWQYGVPAYSSGGPVGGFTGARVIGYNLSGDYAN